VTAQGWIAGAVGVAAIVDDLTRRRISNWIPVCAFASGLILQIAERGWRGAGSALLGTAAGAGIFLIFYLLGGMGGGDVKLMAGFGAVVGSVPVDRRLWRHHGRAGSGGQFTEKVVGQQARGGQRAGKRKFGRVQQRQNGIYPLCACHCGGGMAQPDAEDMTADIMHFASLKQRRRQRHGS